MAIIDKTPHHIPRHRNPYPDHVAQRDPGAELTGMADYQVPRLTPEKPRHRADSTPRVKSTGSKALAAVFGHNVRPV